MKPRHFTNSVFALITLLLLCISYFPSFTGEFIGDDVGRIQQLGSNFSLLTILQNGLGDRPLLCFSLWLDHSVLHFGPGLMRFENFVLLVCLLILMRTIIIWISTKWEMGVNPIWRDACLILFALHPIHTQALTHVVQRGILLSTIGGLFCTLQLLRTEGNLRDRRTLLSLLVWLLAILSKPNVVFLPVFWLIMFWALGYGKKWKNLIPFFLMLAVPVFNYSIAGFNKQSTSATPWNYFLTQGEVIATYAKLILFPIGLRFNRDIAISSHTGLWPGLAWWSLFGITLTMVLRFVRPRIAAVLFLGGFLALLPESSFFPIDHAAFEHRTFTPMTFFALSLALLPARSINRFTCYVIFTLTITWMSLTFQRNLETRKLVDWAHLELMQSCRLGDLIAYNLFTLYEANEVEKIRSAMTQIKKCQPPPVGISLFLALESFYFSPELDWNALDTMNKWTHSDATWQSQSRRFFARPFLRIMVHKFQGEKLHCGIEEFFSNQLRVFSESPKEFAEYISVYQRSAASCLELIKDKPDSESAFRSLKIRTILFAYFNLYESKLEADLLKAPSEPRYDYLRMLYSKK